MKILDYMIIWIKVRESTVAVYVCIVHVTDLAHIIFHHSPLCFQDPHIGHFGIISKILYFWWLLNAPQSNNLV